MEGKGDPHRHSSYPLWAKFLVSHVLFLVEPEELCHLQAFSGHLLINGRQR